MTEDLTFKIAGTVYSFLAGGYIGSYIITIISRYRAKEIIRGGYSHYFNCKSRLDTRQVMPIFSYIVEKGRCPYCKASIGISTFLWGQGLGLAFGILAYTTNYFTVLILSLLIASIIHLIMGVDRKKPIRNSADGNQKT